MTRRPSRSVVLRLTAEEWSLLIEMAKPAMRDPYQHARWLLVRALRERQDEMAATIDEGEHADVA